MVNVVRRAVKNDCEVSLIIIIIVDLEEKEDSLRRLGRLSRALHGGVIAVYYFAKSTKVSHNPLSFVCTLNLDSRLYDPDDKSLFTLSFSRS